MGFSKTSDSQKMKPQPPSNLNSAPQAPLTTDQIQKCLDDNKNLILAILECTSLGKFNESAKYQEILQQNLAYLATIADPQSSTQGSAATSQLQVLINFVLQGNQMEQTQASEPKLQQESDPVPRLPPFLLNAPRSHQDQPLEQLQSDPVPRLPPFLLNNPRSQQDQPLQQLHHLHHPQQFQSQFGFRSAGNSGMMHQIMQPGVSSSGGMDILGSKQAGFSDSSWKPGYGGIQGSKQAGSSDGSWKPRYGGGSGGGDRK